MPRKAARIDATKKYWLRSIADGRARYENYLIDQLVSALVYVVVAIPTRLLVVSYTL